MRPNCSGGNWGKGSYSTTGVPVWSGKFGPGDPRCCPSSYDINTYKFANGTFVKSATTRNVPKSEYPEITG